MPPSVYPHIIQRARREQFGGERRATIPSLLAGLPLLLGRTEVTLDAASSIRSTLRAVDIAARYGGEEFVAVLPEIGADALGIIAERIRSRVASMAPIQGSRRLTVSIGGAVFPADGETAEELFQAADTRLYDAKGAGRNRVVIPEPVRS